MYFLNIFGMLYSSLSNQKEEGERGREEGKLRRGQVRQLARYIPLVNPPVDKVGIFIHIYTQQKLWYEEM